MTELQSEDNSVFASVDVTNGSPTEEDATTPAAATPAPTPASALSIGTVVLVICAVLVVLCCLILLFRSKKNKTEIKKIVTVDVELQSNPNIELTAAH